MCKQNKQIDSAPTRFQSYALRVWQGQEGLRFAIVNARNGKRVSFSNGQQLVAFLEHEICSLAKGEKHDR